MYSSRLLLMAVGMRMSCRKTPAEEADTAITCLTDTAVRPQQDLRKCDCIPLLYMMGT
jgi:hypothetical protein